MTSMQAVHFHQRLNMHSKILVSLKSFLEIITRVIFTTSMPRTQNDVYSLLQELRTELPTSSCKH